MKTKNPTAGHAPAEIPTSFAGSKNFDSKTALAILNQFATEARKELRRAGEMLVTANSDDDHCSVSFVCDGFNLKLEFKEGGQA